MFFIAVKLTKNETKIKITYKGYEKHSLEMDNRVWWLFAGNAIIIGHENYFYLNQIRIQKFKTFDNIPPFYFCLGSVSKDFTNNEMN